MGRKDEEYEVESIIGKRRKKNSGNALPSCLGSVEYRVLWKGWSKDQATWEPEENLENVQEMIDEFNRKLEGRGKPQVSSTITSVQKKNSEETSLNDTKKSIPPKSIRKLTKESDEEANEQEEQEEVKPPVQTSRGRTQRIQEEPPSKVP